MFSIHKATVDNESLLAEMGKVSFIESHESSAPVQEINAYIDEKYNQDVMRDELNDPKNIYHIIYHNDQPAGYSKIIFNSTCNGISQQNVTKLDRIYLLKEFYNLKLGAELFAFILELSKKNNQAGMWLLVWEGNHRAIAFYNKAGFSIIGEGDFRLTLTHSNPNYLMFLQY